MFDLDHFRVGAKIEEDTLVSLSPLGQGVSVFSL